MVLKPMAADAYEPTFAMGDDSPLPPTRRPARPVAHYLRQRFAQVTNPPIDPLRERLVMSLRTLLGPRPPLLAEHADAARLLALESFFLYPVGGRRRCERRAATRSPSPCSTPPSPCADGPGGLEAAVRRAGRRGRGRGRRRRRAS